MKCCKPPKSSSERCKCELIFISISAYREVACEGVIFSSSASSSKLLYTFYIKQQRPILSKEVKEERASAIGS